MKDKLKSTEVEKLKSSEVERLKSSRPLNSSTLQPFNHTEKVYRRCLKQERDREYQWRKSKRKGEIRNVVHLVDFAEAESLENSPSWLSDGGKGEEAIIAACDGETPETRYQRVLRNARRRLKRAKPHLVEVFDLVMENGANRKESICRLMSRNRLNGR